MMSHVLQSSIRHLEEYMEECHNVSPNDDKD